MTIEELWDRRDDMDFEESSYWKRKDPKPNYYEADEFNYMERKC